MPLLAVMCVTGRCGAVTRNSDERHSRDQAGCAIKWTVAILESPASPHDPTQPPPKRRAGPSFNPGGDGSQIDSWASTTIHRDELFGIARAMPSCKPRVFPPPAKSQDQKLRTVTV